METTIHVSANNKLNEVADSQLASLGEDIASALRIFLTKTTGMGLDSVTAMRASLEVVQASIETIRASVEVVQASVDAIANLGLDSAEAMQVFVEKISDMSSNLLTVPCQNDHSMKLGGWEGKIWMADDFDAPMEEFEEYM